MHATRKAGREEDRKVKSMFVSSCVAEHATVALWNMRFSRRILLLVTIKLFANISFFFLFLGESDKNNKNENTNHWLNFFTLYNQNSSVIVLNETL